MTKWDALAATGAAIVAVGFAMIWRPLGPIIIGVCLIVAAYYLDKRKQ